MLSAPSAAAPPLILVGLKKGHDHVQGSLEKNCLQPKPYHVIGEDSASTFLAQKELSSASSSESRLTSCFCVFFSHNSSGKTTQRRVVSYATLEKTAVANDILYMARLVFKGDTLYSGSKRRKQEWDIKLLLLISYLPLHA